MLPLCQFRSLPSQVRNRVTSLVWYHRFVRSLYHQSNVGSGDAKSARLWCAMLPPMPAAQSPVSSEVWNDAAHMASSARQTPVPPAQPSTAAYETACPCCPRTPRHPRAHVLWMSYRRLICWIVLPCLNGSKSEAWRPGTISRTKIGEFGGREKSCRCCPAPSQHV